MRRKYTSLYQTAPIPLITVPLSYTVRLVHRPHPERRAASRDYFAAPPDAPVAPEQPPRTARNDRHVLRNCRRRDVYADPLAVG